VYAAPPSPTLIPIPASSSLLPSLAWLHPVPDTRCSATRRRPPWLASPPLPPLHLILHCVCMLLLSSITAFTSQAPGRHCD
jgi:hypothetical protein